MLGGMFGLLAAASAFVIAYDEYLHHFADRRTARRMAAQTAVTAFLFFLLVPLLLVLILFRLI
jgi:hypothetical protein